MDIELVKSYIPVDFDDDDGLIQLLLNTVLDEMADIINGFDREKPTNRQKLLICAYVKELYDSRGIVESRAGQTALGAERLRYAVQSMMLKEQLGS